MKKLYLGFVAAIILVGFFLFVYVNSAILVTDYSQRAVDLLTAKQNFQGITLEQLSFENAKLEAFDTIVWHDVSAEFTFSAKNGIFSGKKILVSLDDLTVRIESFINQKISCSVNGLMVRVPVIDQGYSLVQNVQQFDGLVDGKASIHFALNLLDKEVALSQLKDLLNDLRSLFDLGRSKYPLTLNAIISFRVRGEDIKALLSSEQEGGESILVINKESLSVLSLLFDEKLTDPEVELLSRNPFRTPMLLRIKDEAQSVSQTAHKRNNSVPEDAYRHILWSYLLTREYGSGFAKQITDAHEQGVTDNTEAEHRMDFTNNRIGRQYALNELRKGEILSQLFRDSEVVWNAK